MKEDRFLTAILLVVALLVVLSVIMFFVRQDESDYLPENTPNGVVHNFILAVSQGDYERAYGYLADEELKPSFAVFADKFAFYQDDAGYRIGEVMEFSDKANVEIIIEENSAGLLTGRYQYVEQARLIKQNGTWKIIEMPYAFWDWGWYGEE
jgi:hypothetical protein